MKKILLIAAILSSYFSFATIFTVTNTNDDGAGSLRQAIFYANGSGAATNSIEFNIPLTDPGYNSEKGVWEIYPGSFYNYISNDFITIDGTSQTANQGDTNPLGPEIVINGNDNSIDFCFSIINSQGIVIKGLCIVDFTIGIQIYGESTQNYITGNYIGISANSSESIGNYIGIEIIGGPTWNTVGGTTEADRNIVSGNEHIGIRIVDANHNAVHGNYVGLDRTGTNAMPNYDGISIEGTASYNSVGGMLPEQRNIVSGNFAYGIPVFGAGCNFNSIEGNYIGTDVTGTIAIPNTYGVLFDDGAGSNIIGGEAPASRNILSGNSGYGVFIYNMGTHDNIVKNNYIGTDVTGTVALPNANGIVIDGAAINSVISENVISGNLQQGIVIHITGSDGHVIEDNYIGTDYTGALPLGNGVDGVRVAEGPVGNVIGPGNIIAFNYGNGVTIMNDGDDKNLITQNSIFENHGLGIDLFPAGITANDAGDSDSGPNQGMNFPEIDNIEWAAGTATISGTLDTYSPENCTIEIFAAEPDEMGYGEGKTYLGNVSPDASGNWIFMAPGVNEADYFTAIATDNLNNSSEFSIAKNIYGPASGKELKQSFSTIFPNPSGDFIQVSSEYILDIQIIDATGKTIYKNNYGGLNSVQIDISGLSPGLYLLQNGRETIRFVKL